MAKLIYSAIMSLDGYIADRDGIFDWAAPDEEMHTFVNDLERPVGAYLYGRRMYEVMAAWDTLQTHDQPPFIAEFAAIWRAADKVVYSKTLTSPSTPRTRVERGFDPEAVRRMKASAARDLTVGGANLAAQAFEAGLVDVCHLFVVPILVGVASVPSPAASALNSFSRRSAASPTARFTCTTDQQQARPANSSLKPTGGRRFRGGLNRIEERPLIIRLVQIGRLISVWVAARCTHFPSDRLL